MVIVSQDRSTVYNFDHIYDVTAFECGVRACVGYQDRQTLESTMGVYETPERAKAVLLAFVECLENDYVDVFWMPEV